MKHIFKVTLFAGGLLIAAQSQAQTDQHQTDQHQTVGHKIGTTATNVGHATAKTATAVGHKTSEIAAKGDAAVVDKKYDGKMARGGQTIYINKHSHYYYVNKLGHRVYVNKSDLRDKPSM